MIWLYIWIKGKVWSLLMNYDDFVEFNQSMFQIEIEDTQKETCFLCRVRSGNFFTVRFLNVFSLFILKLVK